MKVLILGNRLFSVDMLWGFLKAGCDAQIISASNENQIQQIFSTTDADLLITLGTPIELKAEVMKVVGSSRPQHMKYIHWDTDGISSKYFSSVSGDGIEMDVIYNSKPDLVLTMCPEMRELIIEKGFPCEMMHYAYSPVSHQPLQGYENDKYFINLIGNSYSMFVKSHPDHYRYQSLKILLKPLIENKYTIHLYGDAGYAATVKQILGMDVPTLTYHNYMPYERTCAAYNSSFINLVTQNHAHTITKRTFEILGSGGFALSADNKAIRELFVPGRDLIVSSSPEETMELVHYYEKNQDEWKKIRENAAISVENHTYKHRAEYILKLLEKYYF
ncbi:MAG: hypothetical protein K0Q48_1179 [Bacillota bacterium]|jgi:spore maturation protein CgeB|nr:hypothetical protein [Bacillota bacterium]